MSTSLSGRPKIRSQRSELACLTCRWVSSPPRGHWLYGPQDFDGLRIGWSVVACNRWGSGAGATHKTVIVNLPVTKSDPFDHSYHLALHQSRSSLLWVRCTDSLGNLQWTSTHVCPRENCMLCQEIVDLCHGRHSFPSLRSSPGKC